MNLFSTFATEEGVTALLSFTSKSPISNQKDEAREYRPIYVVRTHTAPTPLYNCIYGVGCILSNSFLGRCLAIPDVRWVRAEPYALRVLTRDSDMRQLHIGQLIKAEVKRQGISVVGFARMLGCSRTNIYKIYDHPSIDTAQLQRISSLLHHDFFRFYSDNL